MTSAGVIHGRFQVLHNDHLAYIMAAKLRCEHLVVGITNPDPTLTKEDFADPQRSLAINNPLTYFERYTMVRAVLVEAGLTSMEAIIAGTRNAADNIGKGNELGTIEKGKLADMIVVSGNPLEEIEKTRDIKIVIKDGMILFRKLT